MPAGSGPPSVSTKGSCAQRAKAGLGARAGSLDSVCPDPSSLQWWPAGDSLPGAGVLLVPKPTRPQGASKARHSLRAPNMSLDRGRVSVCVTTRPGRVRVGTPAELQATPSVRNTARASWAWPVTMPPSTPGALGWTGHGGFHGAMLQPSCLPVPTDPSQGGWALTSWVRKPREEEAQMLSSDELVCWSRSAGPTVAKRQGVLRPGDTQVSSALGTRPEPGALRGCRERLLRPVPSAGGGSAPEQRPASAGGHRPSPSAPCGTALTTAPVGLGPALMCFIFLLRPVGAAWSPTQGSPTGRSLPKTLPGSVRSGSRPQSLSPTRSGSPGLRAHTPCPGLS